MSCWPDEHLFLLNFQWILFLAIVDLKALFVNATFQKKLEEFTVYIGIREQRPSSMNSKKAKF